MLDKECDEILITLKGTPSRRISMNGWTPNTIHQQIGIPFEDLKDALARLRTDCKFRSMLTHHSVLC